MARLPQPGGDTGAWGTILNDFLLTSHDSDGALKADVIGDTQVSSLSQSKITNLATDLAAKATDSSVVHLAGSETITGDKNFTGALTHNSNAIVDNSDVRLSDQSGLYPVQAYGFFAMSDVPTNCTTPSFISSGDAVFVRVWVPPGHPIAAIGVLVQTAGTLAGGGENRFGIYNDSGTLLAQTPSDNTLWATTGWRAGVLPAPIPAQSSGRFVYAAVIVNGYTPDPDFLFNNAGQQLLFYGGYGVTQRRHFYESGLAALPGSIDPTTYGQDSSYLLLVGLA